MDLSFNSLLGEALQFFKPGLSGVILERVVRATHARVSLPPPPWPITRVYSYVAGINQSPVSPCTQFFLFTRSTTAHMRILIGCEKTSAIKENVSRKHILMCLLAWNDGTQSMYGSEWIVKRWVINFEPSRECLLERRAILSSL